MRRRLRRFPRRMFWTFADQALSSVTNAALAIVVARSVSRDVFGAFALALLTFSFVIGLIRAFVGEPYVVRFSAADESDRRRGTAQATGAAISLGVFASVVCLAAAALTGAQTAVALCALAIALPGLALQDTWRHVFFAAGRPAAATVNDLVWAVLQGTLIVLILASGSRSIFLITLAWGVAAMVAAMVGAVQARVVPSPRTAHIWLRENHYMGLRLGLGYAVNMGAVNVVSLIIGGLVGLAAIGAVRAAQTVLGPLNLLFAGFNAFMLPLLSTTAASGRRLLRPAGLGSALLGLIALVWVTTLVLLPTSVGETLLGDSWAGAERVMLPSGLVMISVALVAGASNSLIALGRADLMLRVIGVQAALMLILGSLGAWQVGVVAAIYGMALAQAVGLGLCWWIFLRTDAVRAGQPGSSAGQSPHHGSLADPSH